MSTQHGEQRWLAISVPIPLRQDVNAPGLLGFAKKTKDGPQARRLLMTLAAIRADWDYHEQAKQLAPDHHSSD